MRMYFVRVLFAICLLSHGITSGQQPAPSKMVVASKIILRDGKAIIGLVEDDSPKTLRLFDLKTNQVLEINRAEIKEGPTTLSDEDAYKAVPAENIIAARVTRTFPRLGGTGKVASIDGGAIYVTLGVSHGLTEKDQLSVFRGEKVIRDPDSGEVLGKQRKLVANLLPVKIDEKLTKAKLIGELETELQVGDSVEFAGKSMVIAVIPATDPDGNCPQGALKLADALTTRLTEGSATVVERTKLVDVVVELALSSTQLFDSEQSQKIGKQLGATAILTGKVIRDGKLSRTGQISLRLVDVATGRILFATTYKAYPFDFSEGMSLRTASKPAVSKSGASAYDGFPKPLRDRLVKDWEGELKALERAIEDDNRRLKTAKNAQERKKLEGYIVEYSQKLERHKKNNPPFFTKEGREAAESAK